MIFCFHLPRVNTVSVDDNYSSVCHPQSEKQGQPFLTSLFTFYMATIEKQKLLKVPGSQMFYKSIVQI